MPQAREIKGRIANIKDIKQITKAMNAIAMAKVTRLKNVITRARPYQEVMNSKLQMLIESSGSDGEEEPISPLLERSDGERIGLAVFNSDRGLSGNYTVDLNRAARDFIRDREEEVALYAGGDKARRFFKKWDQLEKSWVDFYTEPELDRAEAIGKEMLEAFLEGEVCEFWAIYMKFHSDLKQELVVEKILPLTPPGEEEMEEVVEEEGDRARSRSRGAADYMFDPEREEILSGFLEEWFLERIFWIILNTKTSEHAIRRKAMRDATDNANELIDDLTLTYNKARQQQITREIADIIGGAEALREEA